MRVTSFPLIKRNQWVFKTSISDEINIMIIAFGPNEEFIMRYFTVPEEAHNFVEAVSFRIT